MPNYAFAYNGANQIRHVLRVGADPSSDPQLKTITVNAVFVIQSTLVVANAWTKIGDIPFDYRPNNPIAFELPTRTGGAMYTNLLFVAYAGDSILSQGSARIRSNGDIEVYIQPGGYTSNGGLNYTLIPIHVTYFYIPGASSPHP